MNKLLPFSCIVFLVYVVAVFAQGGCEDEDLDCKFQELENRVSELESIVDDHEDRTVILEAWRETIDIVIDQIVEWVFLSDEGDMCTAFFDQCQDDIACHNNEDCDNPSEELICIDGSAYKQTNTNICINPGTEISFCHENQEVTLIQTCGVGCENGECLVGANGQVIFRTNVLGGNYFLSTNDAWIAFDKDKNGALEGYGIRARGSWNNGRCNIESTCESSSAPCILVKTSTGDKVVDYGNSNTLVVCDELNHKQVFYRLGDSDANNAELSPSPTEPFTSNNQEVVQSQIT